ncbi:OmpA family protein [Jannaschia seohaensis]|nr:OmpA family protein [Jannaschia seohaensis]
MGLTVAEAFMLIAFVLLMLLGVWMASARERITELEERVRAAEPFAQAFTAEQRVAALANRDQLTEIGNDIAKLEAFRSLAEQGASPTEAALALEFLPLLEQGLTPDEALERVRLLDTEPLRALTEIAAARDPEAQAALVELARLEDVPRLADLAQAGTLDADLAKLAAFEDLLSEGLTAEEAAEAAEALAAYRATGLAPGDVAALAAQWTEVAQARLAAAASRDRIATALEAQAGAVVAGIGGEVRPDGSIVFSDRLLFDAGSATLRPEFEAALAELCRPWIETLHANRDALSAVRIEGHASSEWISLPPDLAYERNLDLSQARAAAVFKRCLSLAGQDAVTDWARTRMSAVGFSSSRPVLDADGREDAVASRRVVFAIDTAAPNETGGEAVR